jgi:hypothetical protein
MLVRNLNFDAHFTIYANENALEKEIKGVVVGDLLSNIMGAGEVSNVWVTAQNHLNVVAVALLKEFGALFISGNLTPDQATIDKAMSENLALIVSDYNSYELCCWLYQQNV